MVMYGLRLGKKLVVLKATTVKKAVREINNLLEGPFEIIRTDYQQAEVGLSMKTEKIGLTTLGGTRIVLKMDGEFEERTPVQISESVIFK